MYTEQCIQNNVYETIYTKHVYKTCIQNVYTKHVYKTMYTKHVYKAMYTEHVYKRIYKNMHSNHCIHYNVYKTMYI